MQIRVLQVVTYMGRGGLETMLMNYYRHIDHDKVQFDFLVHRDFRADYDDEIESLGGKIYRIPKLNPVSINYRKTLNAFFEQHQEYKIVHVHQDCLSSIILKAALHNGVPVRIAHSHNAAQDKNFRYIVKLIYRRFTPIYATDLFACSKSAGDWMFFGSSYIVLNNAISTADYIYDAKKCADVRKEFSIEKDEIVIGNVGRIFKQKNHSFLIDIFAALVKKRDAKLILVGDGIQRAEIERKVNALGLADKVVFTGIRSDVNDLMQMMDVFVFPSLYEGLPVTMVEAQASGLPCVISDTISPECIVTNGLVKQLSLNMSPEVWADEIIKSYSIPRTDHSDEIREAGFDITTSASYLEEYYITKSREV